MELWIRSQDKNTLINAKRIDYYYYNGEHTIFSDDLKVILGIYKTEERALEVLININGIREDLYQAMQIGDITLSSKDSQKLVDFMNYQDKEIERLNNELEEFKEEHKIMKQILIENNLWKTLLNDDRFLEYLRK